MVEAAAPSVFWTRTKRLRTHTRKTHTSTPVFSLLPCFFLSLLCVCASPSPSPSLSLSLSVPLCGLCGLCLYMCVCVFFCVPQLLTESLPHAPTSSGGMSATAAATAAAARTKSKRDGQEAPGEVAVSPAAGSASACPPPSGMGPSSSLSSREARLGEHCGSRVAAAAAAAGWVPRVPSRVEAHPGQVQLMQRCLRCVLAALLLLLILLLILLLLRAIPLLLRECFLFFVNFCYVWGGGALKRRWRSNQLRFLCVPLRRLLAVDMYIYL